jgi:hypothetical protein
MSDRETLMTEHVTEEIPAVELTGEDADWDWPAKTARRGIRMRVPTAVLLALLIAAGGIWGGAALQRTRTPSSSASASNLSSLFGGFRRGSGTGSGSGSGTGARSGLGGLGTPAATGTVTVIEGDVLYLTTASGGIQKVVVGKSATVTRTANVGVTGLKPGDTVVVEGTAEKNGTVQATSVTGIAPGVSALGGLGARFGGAGGATSSGG